MDPLAVEGVPEGRVDRAVGVLHDDRVDGEVDVACFPDHKICAKGRPREFFDLAKGEVARHPSRLFK